VPILRLHINFYLFIHYNHAFILYINIFNIIQYIIIYMTVNYIYYLLMLSYTSLFYG